MLGVAAETDSNLPELQTHFATVAAANSGWAVTQSLRAQTPLPGLASLDRHLGGLPLMLPAVLPHLARLPNWCRLASRAI